MAPRMTYRNIISSLIIAMNISYEMMFFLIKFFPAEGRRARETNEGRYVEAWKLCSGCWKIMPASRVCLFLCVIHQFPRFNKPLKVCI